MEALPAHVRVFASHGGGRPGITGLARESFHEPEDRDGRLDWVLRTAVENSIKVILAGCVGGAYEERRADFERAGITLVTGGMNSRTFELVDDKANFTGEAKRAGLACIPATTVETPEQLRAASDSPGPDCANP